MRRYQLTDDGKREIFRLYAPYLWSSKEQWSVMSKLSTSRSMSSEALEDETELDGNTLASIIEQLEQYGYIEEV